MGPGTTAGHYQVMGALGRGGMGEVWRARDTRLQRDVAIKTLPPAFATDPERRSRFEREARLLASLNHPGIAAIHGFDDADGTLFLVMELVEGDTLAERLAHGAIPQDEARSIALQMLDAIEAAHEAGVIHRDLKPSNVKVTGDGKVKVLDFGLAKAAAATDSAPALSHSPTLSLAETQKGVILGTAAYMSPEQARGTAVDKRTDIWAFGCILFEMLSGRQAFGGDTISDIVAGVLKLEPEYSALPPTLPPRLLGALQRCLHKDPRRRWRDAGDLRAEVELAREAPASSDQTPGTPVTYRSLWTWLLLPAAVAVAIAGTAWVMRGANAPAEVRDAARLVRFPLVLPSGASLYAGGWIVPFAVSPDGRHVAFTATSDDGRSRLWVRPLEADAAQVVAGSEGAVNPFWAPTSDWVGFQIENVLYRVGIPAGVPEKITAFDGFTSGASAAAWGNDVIVFAGRAGGLLKVSAQGGPISEATTLSAPGGHTWPQFLSDGRSFLFLARGSTNQVLVSSVDGGQPETVMELAAASTIRYAPGYILYVENMVLWAQPFDEPTRRPIGARRRIVAGVPMAGNGSAPFSISRNGVLAYWTQALIQQAAQLQWIDRRGNRGALVGAPAVYDGFDLSADESRMVSAQVGEDGIRMWVRDLAVADSSFPLKLIGTVPIWAPGNRVVFLDRGVLYIASATGGDSSRSPLTEASRNQLAQDWTAEGRTLVYEDWRVESGIDLKVVDVETRQATRPPFNTSSNEFGGRLSPDDRWIAYVTDQSGRPEVWVAAYPSGDPRRRVDAGSHPSWKADGSELYFISAAGNLVAVPFQGDRGAIKLGAQTNLFRVPGTVDIVAGSHNMYKASGDGQRFLVAVKAQTPDTPPVRMILNWPVMLDVR